jgi:hypothetical protein
MRQENCIHQNRSPPYLRKKKNYATLVASTFNNLFLIVTEKLNMQNPEKGDAISFLKYSLTGNFPSIKIIPTTETEEKVSY